MDVVDTLMYYICDGFITELGEASESKKIDDLTTVGVPNKLGSSRKAFNIWFSQFKPRWKQLQNMYYSAQDPKSKLEVLWKEKELLLNTREAVLDIPESFGLNLAVMTAMIAITFGLSAYIYKYAADHPYTTVTNSTSVTIAGMPGVQRVTSSFDIENDFSGMKMAANVATAVGSVYSAIKLFTLASSLKDSDLRSTQKFGGIMAKQVTINKLNAYIQNVDGKIQVLQSGQNLELNKNAAKAVQKYSTKYMDKVAAGFNGAAKE